MYNRYIFTKKIYPKYLVIIRRKNKYFSFGNDLLILKSINFNNKIEILNDKKINYLILDNLDIIDIRDYIDNQYYRYLDYV